MYNFRKKIIQVESYFKIVITYSGSPHCCALLVHIVPFFAPCSMVALQLIFKITIYIIILKNTCLNFYVFCKIFSRILLFILIFSCIFYIFYISSFSKILKDITYIFLFL